MSVAARFWIQSVEKRAASGGDVVRNVKLAPVVRPSQVPGGEGNVEWSKYTPSGSIELNVSAAAAGEWFEERLGRDIAITFDDVE